MDLREMKQWNSPIWKTESASSKSAAPQGPPQRLSVRCNSPLPLLSAKSKSHSGSMPGRMVSIFIFRSEKKPVLNCPVRKNPRDEKQEKLAVPAVLLSMLSVQGGASIAKYLFPILGPAGTGTLRIGAGRNPARGGQPAAGAQLPEPTGFSALAYGVSTCL